MMCQKLRNRASSGVVIRSAASRAAILQALAHKDRCSRSSRLKSITLTHNAAVRTHDQSSFEAAERLAQRPRLAEPARESDRMSFCPAETHPT